MGGSQEERVGPLHRRSATEASTSATPATSSPTTPSSPFTFHVEKKIVYPTLTRRIQFYIDHDLYLELGEELPTHKDPPKIGGDHPLILSGGHTRWSIHSSWRDDALMLRQQRGEPVMYMSVADARCARHRRRRHRRSA